MRPPPALFTVRENTINRKSSRELAKDNCEKLKAKATMEKRE